MWIISRLQLRTSHIRLCEVSTRQVDSCEVRVLEITACEIAVDKRVPCEVEVEEGAVAEIKAVKDLDVLSWCVVRGLEHGQLNPHLAAHNHVNKPSKLRL